MDVHVRVVPDRRVRQAGLAAWPVFERQRRARRATAEADPTDRCRFRTSSPPLPLRAQSRMRDTAHRPIACPIDRVPDGGALPFPRRFRGSGREFGDKNDRLVR
jgi:hypothetical protein